MKLVFRDSRVVVYDNTFSPAEFQLVWDHVRSEPYGSPSQSRWEKVWHLNDGSPVMSRSRQYSQRPFHNVFDVVMTRFISVLHENEALVGREGVDWEDFSLTTHIYQRGTKISGHRDAGRYAGSCLVYIHPEWSSFWGGELFIPEEGHDSTTLESVPMNQFEDGNDRRPPGSEFGLYIVPRPNRLVLTAPDTYHYTSRVDPDAGENLRCSINGFLLKTNDFSRDDRIIIDA